ncbi:helix-turn-helix transcriptional regulator [Streptomyces sp. SRF1]|uniref:helix-turn-helix transcriptional regulator n=1 Tax=Streptomyces sp. SRF1 TaxID=1549642 RepID=UPI0025AFA07F|nr:helix-turn-helix transcriptional regulator [Streptomyces sp. SRF1]MDN3054468.1 helix-turn-helix transcriptional regulator [Streptomyces sp. SRF1]
MSQHGSSTSGLGGFLRAARARVDPARAGLPSAGVRRVPGLRREEVAVLAGVSANYYTRLEQGRERHPSLQVLDALGRALDLGPDAREHLHRLAGATPSRRGFPQPAVRPDVLELVEEWTTTPALVLNETLDVLAQNRLAAAMHSGFADPVNLALMTFGDPAGTGFYTDWHQVAEAVVASLRLAQGRRPHDPRLPELVGRLSASSAHFRELWDAHPVRGRTYEAKRFTHPVVGALELTYQAFDIRGSDGQELLVYRAERGSRTADSLRLLAGLAAPAPATASAE